MKIFIILSLLFPSILFAQTMPCPTNKEAAPITMQAGDYSGCKLLAATLTINSGANLSACDIESNIIITNGNVNIQSSTIASAGMRLSTGTNITDTPVTVDHFCVDTQGTYSFSGSHINGNFTNASKSFLQDAGAQVSFTVYQLSLCSVP